MNNFILWQKRLSMKLYNHDVDPATRTHLASAKHYAMEA